MRKRFQISGLTNTLRSRYRSTHHKSPSISRFAQKEKKKRSPRCLRRARAIRPYIQKITTEENDKEKSPINTNPFDDRGRKNNIVAPFFCVPTKKRKSPNVGRRNNSVSFLILVRSRPYFYNHILIDKTNPRVAFTPSGCHHTRRSRGPGSYSAGTGWRRP